MCGREGKREAMQNYVKKRGGRRLLVIDSSNLRKGKRRREERPLLHSLSLKNEATQTIQKSEKKRFGHSSTLRRREKRKEEGFLYL